MFSSRVKKTRTHLINIGVLYFNVDDENIKLHTNDVSEIAFHFPSPGRERRKEEAHSYLLKALFVWLDRKLPSELLKWDVALNKCPDKFRLERVIYSGNTRLLLRPIGYCISLLPAALQSGVINTPPPPFIFLSFWNWKGSAVNCQMSLTRQGNLSFRPTERSCRYGGRWSVTAQHTVLQKLKTFYP